jgi:hypothetical protein
MSRSAGLLTAVLLLASQAAVWPQGKPPAPPKGPPDGIYAVQRAGLKEKDVLPLKAGDVLLVDRHRYLAKGSEQPPRYLVVRSAPEVPLDLAGEPKAVREGEEVVSIVFKLRPKAAAALEALTRERLGREIAVVLGGEVVTTHKIRTVIKGGDVQISSCAAGAAGYLLKRLKAHQRKASTGRAADRSRSPA